MSLFQLGNFTLASGKTSRFKVECDELDDGDWETLAYLASRFIKPFGSVVGIPRGGYKLARAMEQYASVGAMLFVDDVFTTGATMMGLMTSDTKDRGLVAFARTEPPPWIDYVIAIRCE